MFGFKTEPVLVSAFIGAALVLLVEFGVPVTTLESAGTDLKEVTAVAKNETQTLKVESTVASVSGSHPSSWQTPTLPIMVIAFALAGLVGCAGRDVTTTPDQTATNVAVYSGRAVELVTSVQNTVNAYATTQGGRTSQTDAFSAAIRDRVIPAAQSVERHLKGYVAIRQSGGVPSLADAEVLKNALDSYEEVVEQVLKQNVPDGISTTVATTVSEIAKLIQNIRDAINAARPSAHRRSALEPVLNS
jgi:type IV pilus biogenesis protein CpaD/CtpE